MRSSILLLGTALSVACAQMATPAAVLPRQETSTTRTYGPAGTPGTPGTVRILVYYFPLLLPHWPPKLAYSLLD